MTTVRKCPLCIMHAPRGKRRSIGTGRHVGPRSAASTRRELKTTWTRQCACASSTYLPRYLPPSFSSPPLPTPQFERRETAAGGIFRSGEAHGVLLFEFSLSWN
jgi:hypothetical protein